ncbi:MAG: hypothetical protein RBT60_08275 [Candidatus Krumholzibacteria bacterium]|nr:hypothetical protein [Candidatus Krumholzibacteria bacterium]
MRQDFAVTRAVLLVSVLGLLVWAATVQRHEPPSPQPAPTPLGGEPSAPPASPPSWEDDLSSPEIQAVWQERRLLLADLSRRFRAETDSARAAALRREMERVIARTERDVLALRLERARRVGQSDLAARLESALARLGPPADIAPEEPEDP